MKKYVIDNFDEFIRAYTHSYGGSLEESKFVFYNKEHYGMFTGYDDYIELSKINTYNDALLYRKSEYESVRTICEYILKGDIVI